MIMKSLKKCTPKIHKEFSIEKDRSYMKQLKNQNMILVFVILATLTAAVALEDAVDCEPVVDNSNTAFKCNNINQGIDLSECVFNNMELLSISSCANVTGFFGIQANGMVKFENIGTLDIRITSAPTLQKLEFVSIDKILDINYESFIGIATLGLFRISNARIDKFTAVLNRTDITQLELRNVTIGSLEAINILKNGAKLTIIDCHFKNITGPLNFHMFENITIERSIFIFSDFNDLSLAGNVIHVHNNSIVNAAIKITAKNEASVHYTCGLKSSMHIKSNSTSSSNNFLPWEITYDPPKKMYRNNNQICTKETCRCNYSNAGSIHSNVWYTLIFTVIFFLRFSFRL